MFSVCQVLAHPSLQTGPYLGNSIHHSHHGIHRKDGAQRQARAVEHFFTLETAWGIEE